MKLTEIWVLLLMAFGLSPARAQSGSFERTLQVSGPVSMEVTSGAGAIVVHTGGNGRVHLVAKIHARDAAYEFWLCWFGPSSAEQIRALESNPPIEQRGDVIHIGRMNDGWTSCPLSIDYDLTVPAQTGLIAHSGSGEESIDGLELPTSAGTGSGKITVKNIGGELHLSSGSGSLNAGSVKGALFAHTGSGRIQATGVSGKIVATSGSGSVEIEQAAAGDVNVGTGSGSVTLRGIQGGLRVKTASGRIEVEGEPTADWHIGTASGNIDLKTPSQVSFDFDGSTLSGKVTVDRPLTVQGWVSRHHFQAKAGNGGALLEARTLSGDIHID
jgi:hypothetical protein